MLLPCPQCGNGNPIFANVCQCGFQLLLGKPQPEQQRYAETGAASQAAQHPEMFPTKSENLIRIPLPQAPLESARKIQNQAALETLPLAEESESQKLGNVKSNVNLKRFLVLASFLIIAGAAVLAILGGFTEITQGGKQEEKEQTSLAEASPQAPDSQNSAASNPADENSITGKVVDVAGGDTITVADASSVEYKIRLEGIVAPEPEQEFGAEAESNLFNLAFGKTVQVNLLKPGTDGYTVGRVMLDGNNVSFEQLKAGLAWHDKTTIFEESDKDLYVRDENAARINGLGLWAVGSPLPPWEYSSKDSLQESVDQTIAADRNGKTPKFAPNYTLKAKAVVQETSGAPERQTVFTEIAPERAPTKSSATSGSIATPTKVLTPVSPVYESNPIDARKPPPGSLPPAKARKRDENPNSIQRDDCFIIVDGKKVYLERGACAN